MAHGDRVVETVRRFFVTNSLLFAKTVHAARLQTKNRNAGRAPREEVQLKFSWRNAPCAILPRTSYRNPIESKAESRKHNVSFPRVQTERRMHFLTKAQPSPLGHREKRPGDFGVLLASASILMSREFGVLDVLARLLLDAKS